MGNFRKMIIGERMPDKNDPQYKEKYEKDVEAGRRFARLTGLDRLAARIQKFADTHRRLFLAIVFGFVIGCLGLNIYHMTRAYSLRKESGSATQRQERLLVERIHKAHTITPHTDNETTE